MQRIASKLATMMVVAVLSCVFSTALAETELTEKNWRKHPAIVQVRNIYKKTAKLDRSKKLKRELKRFNVSSKACIKKHAGQVDGSMPEGTSPAELAGDFRPAKKTLFKDGSGAVVKYVIVSRRKMSGKKNAADVKYLQEFYYDPAGRLRFFLQQSKFGSLRLYFTNCPAKLSICPALLSISKDEVGKATYEVTPKPWGDGGYENISSLLVSGSSKAKDAAADFKKTDKACPIK